MNAISGIAALYGMIDRAGSAIEPALRSLVRVRVSQINHCPFCVDLNSATLMKRGSSAAKTQALGQWRDSTLFHARERELTGLIAFQNLSSKFNSAFAALAVLAAVLVLVRPICELWHAHAGAAADVHTATWVLGGEVPDDAGTPAALCCLYVGDTGAAGAMQAAWRGGSIDWQPQAPASITLAAVASAFIVRRLYWRWPLPRTPHSFYLRSARIRR